MHIATEDAVTVQFKFISLSPMGVHTHTHTHLYHKTRCPIIFASQALFRKTFPLRRLSFFCMHRRADPLDPYKPLINRLFSYKRIYLGLYRVQRSALVIATLMLQQLEKLRIFGKERFRVLLANVKKLD